MSTQLAEEIEAAVHGLETEAITERARLDRLIRMLRTLASEVTPSGHRREHANILSWDDLRFAPDAFNPLGIAGPPTLDNATVPGTWLFSGTTENNIAATRQVPHRWQAGSTMQPHIHWEKTTTAAGSPLWQECYSIANVGAVFPAYSAWINATNAVRHADTVRMRALDKFPELTMPNKRESCVINVKIRRLPTDPLDNYGDDARFVEFDIHYLSDKDGTEEEYPVIG